MWELRTCFEGAYIFLSELLSNWIMGLLERILDAGFRLLEVRAIGTPAEDSSHPCVPRHSPNRIRGSGK